MPDPQRPLRRHVPSGAIVRTLTHLPVIGLLAFTAIFGVEAHRALVPGNPQWNPGFALVTRARGAAAEEFAARSTRFELAPGEPTTGEQELTRQLPRSAPSPTPLPTPVPPPASQSQLGVAAAPAQPQSRVIVGSGALSWPVSGGTITQYFHAGHLAIDIAAPAGSRVNAAADGVVTFAGWRNNGGGLVVVIDHGNGLVTGYNHLGVAYVTPGQAVSRGTAIAAVGCTGICTGPHVHFEVIVGGVLVNPLRYL